MEQIVARMGPILVPLDGSEIAERALAPAQQIARALDCELLLAQALPISTWAFAVEDAITTQETYDEILREEEASASTYLTQLANRMCSQGRQVTTSLVRGEPAPALLAVAADFGASLVVMSTHGRSGLGRVTFGSVADGIVRRGNLPVFLLPSRVREVSADRLTHAIVALDGSNGAESALTLACAWMGRALRTVELARVVPADATTEERATAEQYLAEVARKLAADGPQCSGGVLRRQILEGDPAQALLAAALNEEAFIIMATRGHTGLQRIRLGSVAERVVRDADMPVLVMRAQVAGT